LQASGDDAFDSQTSVCKSKLTGKYYTISSINELRTNNNVINLILELKEKGELPEGYMFGVAEVPVGYEWRIDLQPNEQRMW
jgi:hypothetical protein